MGGSKRQQGIKEIEGVVEMDCREINGKDFNTNSKRTSVEKERTPIAFTRITPSTPAISFLVPLVSNKEVAYVARIMK